MKVRIKWFSVHIMECSVDRGLDNRGATLYVSYSKKHLMFLWFEVKGTTLDSHPAFLGARVLSRQLAVFLSDIFNKICAVYMGMIIIVFIDLNFKCMYVHVSKDDLRRKIVVAKKNKTIFCLLLAWKFSGTVPEFLKRSFSILEELAFKSKTYWQSSHVSQEQIFFV